MTTALDGPPPARGPSGSGVEPGDRIPSLDVLRGWAVFGMLVVNVGYFSRVPAARPEGADAVAAVLVQLLASGKFWTLFSVLFGYGVALQLERAERRGEPFGPGYARRLVVLLLFGLVHALWHPAEILHRYAVLGAVLAVTARASMTTLAAVAGLSLAALVLVPTPGSAVDPGQAAAVYASGTLVEVWTINLRRFAAGWMDIRFLEPLPFFLVGLALGRMGLLHRSPERFDVVRRARWPLLGVGAALQLTPLVAAAVGAPRTEPWVAGLVITLMTIGNGLLGLFYAAVVRLALERPAGRRLLHPLAAVGRLALTNYLLQTAVVTTLLYGYGGGLYGRVGDLAALPIAGLAFGVTAAFSVWWVRHRRYGPAEWLWRRLARGRSAAVPPRAQPI